MQMVSNMQATAEMARIHAAHDRRPLVEKLEEGAPLNSGERIYLIALVTADRGEEPWTYSLQRSRG